MKIIRHTARDMRQALRSIREQLGEDAVILSTRRTGEGVEITAAVDFDATSLQAASAPAPTAPAPAAPEPVHAPFEHIARELRAAAAQSAPTAAPGRTVSRPTLAFDNAAPGFAPSAAQGPAAAAPAPAPAFAATAAAPAEFRAPALAVPHSPAAFAPPVAVPPAPAAASDAMSSELKTLRRMLETQLAQLAWNDRTRRAPVHTELLRELTEIGITQDLAEHLIKQLPDDVDLAYGRRFAITGLSQYLRVTGDRWLDNGGRVALIGGTGVGKTTTIAKLAVRWCLRHGPRDLALVSCDTVRIGAQAQMQALGQLLGAPVYTPESFETVPALVSRLDRYRLVLIDTPGSSLRDAELGNRMTVLANSASRLETALVLGANTQAGALVEAVKRFAPANPSCCLLTKVDEAASLGGALSVLIRSRLPISYMSEGQRVPEDLRPARALELVSAAVRLAKASGAAADEDLLRRRFGKSAHALT